MRRRLRSKKSQQLERISKQKSTKDVVLPEELELPQGFTVPDGGVQQAHWRSALAAFGQQRYGGEGNAVDVQQERLHTLDLIIEKWGCGSANLTLQDVVAARGAMNKGTAGARDGVVVEMLIALPFVCILLFWRLFQDRLESKTIQEGGEFWRYLELVGLPKKQLVHEFGDWRLISLTPSTQKWYLRSLLHVIHRTARPFKCRVFGFVPGRCTQQVTEVIARLLRLSDKWKTFRSLSFPWISKLRPTAFLTLCCRSL